jgi:hypothetical protein
VKIARAVVVITVGNHGFKGRRGLLERAPGQNCITAKVEQAKPEAKKRVSVTLQVVAEKSRKFRSVRG